MWLLGKDKIDQLKPVLNSAYYTKWVNYLLKFLRYSRQKKYYNNPFNVLSLQIAYSKTIAGLESVISEGKAELKKARNASNKKLAKDIEIGLTSNRQIVRIIKTIADGFAWRILNYDRPFLRTMAESQRYPGSVKLDSNDQHRLEEMAIKITASRNSKVLLNDITYFLRLGDLTEVGERTIVWESKKSSKKLLSAYTEAKKKGGKTSTQLRKVISAQILRDYREIPVGKEIISVLELPVKFENHLDDVRKLIDEAKESLFSTRQFGNYLIVSCTDQDQMISQALKTKEKIWERFNDRHKWDKKDIVLPYSNLDYFYDEGGDFFRSSVPYSVYPFSDEVCMGLISGKLFLKSQLNISEVKRLFTKSGWEVIEVDIDKSLDRTKSIVPEIFKGDIYEKNIDDTIFGIRRGAFSLNVPWYWVARIATEFMNPIALITQVELMHKVALQHRRPRKIWPFILGEKEVWK